MKRWVDGFQVLCVGSGDMKSVGYAFAFKECTGYSLVDERERESEQLHTE